MTKSFREYFFGGEEVQTHIEIKKLHEDSVIPTRGSAYAAGYDLYAYTIDPIIIHPGTTVMVGTGISIKPIPGTFGAIFARSGLATKQGLRPANCVGVCDEDYTGEYIVAIHNDSAEARVINNQDRIAQVVFLPYVSTELMDVDLLAATDRGDGGFGSTGA